MTLPVFLPLPIQLEPATFYSRRCTSTILLDDGPHDISDLPDVMATTSDEDIPDLEDIFDFEYGLWFG